jgi:hypothetical protein
MTSTKQIAVILAIVFGFFLLIVSPPLLISSLAPESAGLAAVSVGISEAIVEALVVLVVVVIAWRVWIFARRHVGASR